MSNNMINWLNNIPYSIEFNDIYFSTENGEQETEHVFVRGNDLRTRFKNAKNSFMCAETGFGTGLNFFVIANLWQELAPQSTHLHFISVEKFPLSLSEMQKTCALWPNYTQLQQTFLAHYKTLKNGQNDWQIRPNITLELWVADVEEALSRWALHADAWLLDGFAPAKNSEMWSEAVFAQMARLSKPGTTFATFTSASVVRRGLQTAGFQVNKYVGFGKKREMLCGLMP